MAVRVLVVEDDAALAAFLTALLTREGLDAAPVPTGAAALAAVVDAEPDLVLLDVRLPDISGLEVCRRLRRRPGHLPVVMLTGATSRADELAGFAARADAYVTKPVDPATLVARLRAVLRLAGAGQRRTRRLGRVEVDLAARELRREGRVLACPPREFALLAFLLEHPGRVFGRSQLLAQVWGPDYDGDPHTLTARVSRLRQLVEPAPHRPVYLRTRSGVGYYLVEDPPR